MIDRIRALGAISVRKMEGIEETVKFPLPKGLRLDGQASLDSLQK
jgi:4-hydroxy-3-methylbut-2-enyl diphosphate reductase